MAELATLARPYGRAAFEVANKEGQLPLWSEALATTAAVTHNKKVKSLLSSPSLTAKQKSDAIVDVLGDVSSPQFANFIAALAENDRLMLVPEIFNLFSAMKAQQEKSVDVSVTSAYAIGEALESKLAGALTKSLARTVNLTTEIDKNLLGGAIIRAGDTVIDGSLKGRLSKLAETMNA